MSTTFRGACTAVLATVLILFSPRSPAHGGGLNAEGWHNNRRTGDYHCHRAGSSAPPQFRRPQGVYAVPETPPSSNGCGSKFYCSQMASCAEALFYLHSCGLGRLDGDSDGIPCETLCGGRWTGQPQAPCEREIADWEVRKG